MALNRVMRSRSSSVDGRGAGEQLRHDGLVVRRRPCRVSHACRVPSPRNPRAARSQKSSTVWAASTSSTAAGSTMAMTLRPSSQKLAIDHRETVFTRQPGRRARRPISSAGSAASMAAISSG